MVDPSVALFGPLDTLVAPYIEFVLLALVLLNFVSRRVAHGQHVEQAEDGADAITRHPFHSFTSWGLILASFYFLTLHHHAGMVLSTLVIGTYLADFFEFEARKVEAREDHGLDRPKGALVAASFTFLYVGYLSVFFLIEPLWSAVI